MSTPYSGPVGSSTCSKHTVSVHLSLRLSPRPWQVVCLLHSMYLWTTLYQELHQVQHMCLRMNLTLWLFHLCQGRLTKQSFWMSWPWCRTSTTIGDHLTILRNCLSQELLCFHLAIHRRGHLHRLPSGNGLVFSALPSRTVPRRSPTCSPSPFLPRGRDESADRNVTSARSYRSPHRRYQDLVDSPPRRTPRPPRRKTLSRSPLCTSSPSSDSLTELGHQWISSQL